MHSKNFSIGPVEDMLSRGPTPDLAVSNGDKNHACHVTSVYSLRFFFLYFGLKSSLGRAGGRSRASDLLRAWGREPIAFTSLRLF